MTPLAASPGPRFVSILLLKTPGETGTAGHCGPIEARMSDTDTSTEHAQCPLLSRRKKNVLTDTPEQQNRILEKQIQELLEVNKQWDQQFRSMKVHYEKKITELKVKLEVTERNFSKLEKERHQGKESARQHTLTRDRLLQEEKEKETLNGELNGLKKENELLKLKNASVNKKKEQCELEIKRLNKALQDALKMENFSLLEPYLHPPNRNCSHEELRTQMEVLRQQVQIYEEDFKKERSDRERLNEEKEELQKINESSQSQLNKLNSQIKACQKEKEKLEKQLKQVKDHRSPVDKQYCSRQLFLSPCNCGLLFHLPDPREQRDTRVIHDQQQHPPDYQWYAPDQFPPDVQHKANGSSEKEAHQ
ncbi:TNFAIP3-interacting protein 3 isoform X2 [Ornithorhynchus anatinus]|uniref:TNFAIP3-interacting protein 3 isoform X2 n=1 Tax=Ornithorhynchus anatinus TaxID=9258 RepID=UPI0004548946|nr:TNFAIP3-interacting protein 3 isoform X2 [Ornithorhynchus anatinus]